MQQRSNPTAQSALLKNGTSYTVVAGYYRVTQKTGLLYFFARLTRGFFDILGFSRCQKPVI